MRNWKIDVKISMINVFNFDNNRMKNNVNTNILFERKIPFNPRTSSSPFPLPSFIFSSSLQDEINRMKKDWNHQLVQLRKEHENENLEHRAMIDECETLRAELKMKENHINRYKKELEDALDRERALEEAKAQLDLDWQKRIDQNQRQEYHKSEDLIEKISTAHEQVHSNIFLPQFLPSLFP